MKSYLRLFILGSLLSFSIGALAANLYGVHLPMVRSAPAATQCSTVVPLLNQDTGTLSAVLTSDGRYLVAYQDREHGSRAHIVQHVGNHLVELIDPLPADLSLPIGPQLSPPGVKQGSVALVAGAFGQRDRLYYTQRVDDDDPTIGPYALWCMELPGSPAPSPVPLKPPGDATPVDGRKSATPTP